MLPVPSRDTMKSVPSPVVITSTVTLKGPLPSTATCLVKSSQEKYIGGRIVQQICQYVEPRHNVSFSKRERDIRLAREKIALSKLIGSICDICDRPFQSKQGMIDHCKVNHKAFYDFLCTPDQHSTSSYLFPKSNVPTYNVPRNVSQTYPLKPKTIPVNNNFKMYRCNLCAENFHSLGALQKIGRAHV